VGFAKYPNEYDDLPIFVDGITPVNADGINCLRNSILAIEHELGIDPSATFGTVRARLDDMDQRIAQGGGGNTGKSKASAADQSFGFLDTKIRAGSNVTISLQNAGGNEFLEISSTGGSGTGELKISSDDTTFGFADTKFVAGTNVTLAILNPGANEVLQISSTGGATTGEIKISSDDTTLGFADTKFVAGANITLNILNPGANETLEIVGAAAATPALSDVLTAGSDTGTAGINFSNSASTITSSPGVPISILSSDDIILDGYLTFQDNIIHNVGAPIHPKDAATKAYVDSQFHEVGTLQQVMTNGSTTSVPLTLEAGSGITTDGDTTNLSISTPNSAGTPADIFLSPGIGGVEDGQLRLDGYISAEDNIIHNVAEPIHPKDAATKFYVDSQFHTPESLEEVLTTGNDTGSLPINISNSLSGITSSSGIDIDIVSSANITLDTDGYIFLDGYINSSTDLVEFKTNVKIDGDLEVTGVIDPEGLILFEQPSVPRGQPTTGTGTLWVKDTSPTSVFYTDDAGTDFNLSEATQPYTFMVDPSGTPSNTLFTTLLSACTAASLIDGYVTIILMDSITESGTFPMNNIQRLTGPAQDVNSIVTATFDPGSTWDGLPLYIEAMQLTNNSGGSLWTAKAGQQRGIGINGSFNGNAPIFDLSAAGSALICTANSPVFLDGEVWTAGAGVIQANFGFTSKIFCSFPGTAANYFLTVSDATTFNIPIPAGINITRTDSFQNIYLISPIESVFPVKYNQMICADTTISAFGIELPAPGEATEGQSIIIVDGYGTFGTNAITVTSAAGLINGDPSVVLDKPHQSLWVVPAVPGEDGYGWIIASQTQLASTTPTLAQVLAVGNTTGATPIEISSGSSLVSSDGTISVSPVNLDVTAGDAFPASGDVGAWIKLIAGNGDGAAAGGVAQLISGSSSTGSAGIASVLGGTGNVGGAIQIRGGTGTASGGVVQVRGGSGGTGAGDVQVLGGTNASGAGGDVFITGGLGTTEDGYIYLDGYVSSSSDLIEFKTAVKIDGDLEVTGIIDPEGLVLINQAVRPLTPTAVQGLLWTNNATPNKVIFTDNQGNDTELGSAGAGTLAQTLVAGNLTGPTEIEIESGSKIISSAGTISLPPIDLILESGSAFGGSGDDGAIARLLGGDGDGVGAGGEAAILGGSSSSDGGPASLRGGGGLGGGPVQVRGGTGTASGGEVQVRGGSGGTQAGDVQILGGTNLVGPGGDVFIVSGPGSTEDGYIYLDGYVNSSSDLIEIKTNVRIEGTLEANTIFSSPGSLSTLPTTLALTSGSAFLGSNNDGALLSILAGDGDGAAAGGNINILTGSSGSGTGGLGSLRGGTGDVGGSVQLRGGTGTNSGGQVQVRGGTGGTEGGDVLILGGTNAAGNGGDVFITGGSGTTEDGYIYLDGYVNSSTSLVEFKTDVKITGDLEVTGIIDPIGLILIEQALEPTVPTSTQALLWSQSSTNSLPNTLNYSDNQGTAVNVSGNLVPDRILIDQALVTQGLGLERPFSFAFDPTANGPDAWVVDAGAGFFLVHDGYDVEESGPLDLGAVVATAGFTRLDDNTGEVLEVIDSTGDTVRLFDAVFMNGTIWAVGQDTNGGYLFGVTPGSPSSTIIYDGYIPNASFFSFDAVSHSANFLYGTSSDSPTAYRIDPLDPVDGTTTFQVGPGDIDELYGTTFDPINNRIWIGALEDDNTFAFLYAFTGDTTTEVAVYNDADFRSVQSITYGAGKIWAVGYNGSFNPTLFKVDSTTATLDLSKVLDSVIGYGFGVAYDEVNDKVWVSGYNLAFTEIIAIQLDPTTLDINPATPVTLGDGIGYLKASNGRIWAPSTDSSVAAIDPNPTPTVTIYGPKPVNVWQNISDMEGYGLVSTTSADASVDSLSSKVVGGTDITTQVLTNGQGVQQLEINFSGTIPPASPDNKVSVNAGDSGSPAFLDTKLLAGTGVNLPIAAGAMTINVPLTADIGKVAVDSGDALDYLEAQILSGAGVAVEQPGGANTPLSVRVDAFGDGLENGAARRAAVNQYGILAPQKLTTLSRATYASGKRIVGMTFDGELIWTTQPTDGTGNAGVIRSYPYTGPFGTANAVNEINVADDGYKAPIAVGWDGQYIWVFTETTYPTLDGLDRVLRYDITGGSHALVDATFAPSGGVTQFGAEPTIFTFDGQSMVLNLADLGGGWVTKYNPQDMSTVSLSSLPQNLRSPIFDGQKYWFLNVIATTSVLYEIELGAVGVAPVVSATHSLPTGVAVKMAFDGANLWINLSSSIVSFNVLTHEQQTYDFSAEFPTGGIADLKFDGEVLWLYSYITTGPPSKETYSVRFLDPQSGRLLGGPVEIGNSIAGTGIGTIYLSTWSPETGVFVIAGGSTSPLPELGAFNRKRPGLTGAQARLGGARALAGICDDLDITGLATNTLVPAQFLYKNVIPIIGSGTVTLGFTEDGYGGASSGPYIIDNQASGGVLTVSDHTFLSTLVIAAGPHSFYIDQTGTPILLY